MIIDNVLRVTTCFDSKIITAVQETRQTYSVQRALES